MSGENAIMPWGSELAACTNMGELSQLWQKANDPIAISQSLGLLERQGLNYTVEQLQGRMSTEWSVRGKEIQAAVATGPSDHAIATARQKLAEIDDESMQATLDYGDAVVAYATHHANHKKTRSATYMRMKAEAAIAGEKLTDGMAEMKSDSDEAVAQLYFDSELAEAKMKAAKARLDHLERSFQYHRSLMVREDRMDNRPGVS